MYRNQTGQTVFQLGWLLNAKPRGIKTYLVGDLAQHGQLRSVAWHDNNRNIIDDDDDGKCNNA